ncbi:MAG: hypothetical protein A3J09_00240 [Candidatus Zambryskibacteria bacterium RIFCSPLOWO2_02_FULL_51_21]|uniref:Uncharacterized protein n=1 Tax=Candidatus Zambryskibacteria bacterium RIFCSPHIGHO2_02_FULL_43_37 TaxID=1802749 RepID=A0A1G2THY0_9BACT|nr:MAG: hypothetical protein A2723_00240 [Candidatus Zambryskibacteria bacterium RIFCSPHIGHO2_01_FULL_52_18]OHA96887.1 MAG: hypothetical protein A3D49_02140 [Candidatus Zambryskibacteria bacterium RIFCSPHIGHO2_02_FULL_43_37]OHB07056.1 MAG: hypothetical protein A2944_02215 [Candidatus Zambryskibacteria bacterium RIFCSPLOWO2_01_FULL_52_12]OHB10999.1 MAG: hypothetical protein A3J09_00240 [Candidatus Zambryskibacteria bacterium RIFCSPLOWO2_02_FULL_51_21]
MNPEERHLLERSVKLAQENNEMLRSIQARARRQTIYGFIKLVIVILPFVLGYIFLQPYFDDVLRNYNSVRELFDSMPR